MKYIFRHKETKNYIYSISDKGHIISTNTSYLADKYDDWVDVPSDEYEKEEWNG